MTNPQPTATFSQNLHIRLAEADDFAACAALPGDYQTNYVWQMNLRERDRSVQVVFDEVRLPRTMDVAYPYPCEAIISDLPQAQYVILATYQTHPEAPETIIGWLSGSLFNAQPIFHVSHLLVHPEARRRGVGKKLLRAVPGVLQNHACQRVKLFLQSKNHPAIALARKTGFVYSGYDDRYFANGDIALIFSLTLPKF